MNNFTKFDLRISSKSEGSNLFELQFTRSISGFDVNTLRDCLIYCSPFGALATEFIITNIQCMLASKKSCFIIENNLYDFDIYIFLQKLD